MSVMKKVMTLLRGSVREIGETVVDANATRIYEQEILDAKQSIAQAKDDLAGVMAKEMQSARQIEKLQAEIERYEGLAVEALDKSQEALAEEVAGKVGGLEQELQEQTRAHAAYAVQVTRLKDLIKQAEARIREHEREIGVAKTTESVYRATRSISENIGQGGSKLMSARESLDRIKQRHEDLADRMTAAEQLNNEFGQGALEKKLAAAGVGDEAKRQSDVMARIRARRAAQGGDQPAEPGAQ
ncbi:PspA/IM30 family protein [Hydrogenophaga flava]|uniref:PspA/IM30 family protein n=1 Tax=Hydrogenophaga flava TaxID=65657 RepID=UPI0008240CFD|nr:PspA/IM30 family protein [Hydrogenophaga flava]